MRRLRHEWQRTRAAPTIPGTADAEAERSDGPKGCPAPLPLWPCRGAQLQADQGRVLLERNAVKRVCADPA